MGLDPGMDGELKLVNGEFNVPLWFFIHISVVQLAGFESGLLLLHHLKVHTTTKILKLW